MTRLRSRRAFLKSSFAAALALSTKAGFAADTRTSSADAAGWIKSQNNPILSLGRAGEFDSQNIFAPAIVKERGKYFLFYAGGPSGPANGGDFVRYQLGLALSDDGTHFVKRGKPLLQLGKRDNFHATPALLRNPAGNLHKIDGRWQMVYCGNRADDVELATSDDGLDWTKEEGSPIYRGAYAPNLVQAGDELRMYYVHKPRPGADGRTPPWEIHLATGRDLRSLQPHSNNPMLSIAQPWERGALFYPYVLREDDTWIMFYAAYWAGQPDGVQRTAIGMALSRDGIDWNRYGGNPVLTPDPSGEFDSHYTSSQSVIRDGDGYAMFYASRIDRRHKYYAICKAVKRGRLAS